MLVSTLEMPGESLGANQGNSVCWDMAIGKKASGALSAQGRDQKKRANPSTEALSDSTQLLSI